MSVVSDLGADSAAGGMDGALMGDAGLERPLAFCDARLCPTCCTIRKYIRNARLNPWAKGFLALSLVDAAFLIALVVLVLVGMPSGEDQEWDSRGVYAGVGLVVTVAQLAFAWDAVFTENKFQFAASQMTAVFVTFYVVWHCLVRENFLGQDWERARWAILGIRGFIQLLYWAVLLPVWETFGFVAYKAVGADVLIQSLYERYKAFLSALKVDLLLYVITLALGRFFVRGPSLSNLDFWLGVAALVITGAFAYLGWVSVTHEWRGLAWFFVSISLFLPAWVAYKVWELKTYPGQLPADVTIVTFIVAGGLAIIARICLIVCTLLCISGFGVGLRRLLFEHRDRVRKATTVHRGSLNTMAAPLHRFSDSDGQSVESV